MENIFFEPMLNKWTVVDMLMLIVSYYIFVCHCFQEELYVQNCKNEIQKILKYEKYAAAIEGQTEKFEKKWSEWLKVE